MEIYGGGSRFMQRYILNIFIMTTTLAHEKLALCGGSLQLW